MPKDKSLKKILLIGSGPIVIGQASEFDYSGTQALRALKSEGYEVVLVNSNPATIMTDPDLSDRVYVEPLNAHFLEMIIEKERPDAILPTMGGQTALNLAVELAEKGVLDRFGVRMLGANLDSIRKAEDRELFKKTMLEIGVECARSKVVSSLNQGLEYLETIGLPAILRPSFTLGGEGGGIAHTKEEFIAILERGLFLSPTRSVLVEESLLGWKEFELEVVRDRADNVIIVCSIENLDPMGIHTGDSITVAPAQTLTDREYQHLRDLSKKIIRAIGVETGGSNIQFAIKPHGPDAGRTIVIEMNPRVSRSSALASKATGFPIAKIAAKLAVGYTLDELKNEITSTTPASFEPSIDYVVTKIPRFDFEKFQATPPILGTQMKSVGEAMAIGKTFKESFLKALASQENRSTWLKRTEFDDNAALTDAELEQKLSVPYQNRIFYVASALRRGFSSQRIEGLSGINPWFVDQIAEILELEKILSQKPFTKWSNHEFLVMKQFGFLDRDIARVINLTETEVTGARIERGIEPNFDVVDTCAGEFEATTPYYYSTYGGLPGTRRTPKSARKSVLILGGGPNRIGQGIEFDYCCVHAAFAAREEGLHAIVINCNPETVSTDYDISSRLYFEPLTQEHVLNIHRLETGSMGAIVQFGGQTPLKLSGPLAKAGIPILGTSVESIDIAEDRRRFEKLISGLAEYGIKQPASKTVSSVAEAVAAATTMQFPILIRPSYVLGGRGMRVVDSMDSLAHYMTEAIEVSDKHPVLLDTFLANAIEVDVDAISDGEQVLICGVLEHIEETGIHSGDSACSLPPFTLSAEAVKKLRKQTDILARKLNVRGFINVQFAVKNGDVYIVEVNPRASRTVPFIAKAVDEPLAKIAAKVMLGKSLRTQGYTQDFDQDLGGYYNVKMPVFPFHKFPKTDVVLGPEMKSTGEVMGRAPSFAAAYAKGLLGAGIKIPATGVALLSIADPDKEGAIDIAKSLFELGFEIEATEGTAKYLRTKGISCTSVSKIGEVESDHCVERLTHGKYALVINTTKLERSIQAGYAIRRAALEKRVPYCTVLTTAKAFLQAIREVQSRALPLVPIGGKRSSCQTATTAEKNSTRTQTTDARTSVTGADAQPTSV